MTLAEETTVDELELETELETEEPTIPDEDDKQDEEETGTGEDEKDIDSDDETESDDEMSNDDSDEVIISIGDESLTPKEKPKTPDWVREIRKSNKELKKENRKLQEQVQAVAGVTTQPTTLGKKPKLEDFEYEEDKFEKALDEWHEKKHEIKKAEIATQAKKQEEQARWQSKIDSYNTAKSKLKVSNFEDAEDIVEDTLNKTQQGIIKGYVKKPADMVYALGNYPKVLKELAAVTDPVEFSIQIGKLETKISTKQPKRKPATKPEKLLKSSGGKTGSSQSALDKLRAEAKKTGDMTKYFKYKKQMEK